MTNKREVSIRLLIESDLSDLNKYLHGLSNETKTRFGPHNFDIDTLQELYVAKNHYRGYVAEHKGTIVAYSIVKMGYLDHDAPRLQKYGLQLNQDTDCTLAPSVADNFQGQGIGSVMLKHVLRDLVSLGRKRVILWGGVQASNHKAYKMYSKKLFSEIGHFEYNGKNIDMVLNLLTMEL